MNETMKTVIKAAAVLIVFGFSLAGIKIDEGLIVTGISGAVAFATMCFGIWRNFNFTRAAQQGQMVTDKLKNEQRALELRDEED